MTDAIEKLAAVYHDAKYERHDCPFTAIISEIQADPLEYLEVKPLEWEKHPDLDEWYSLPQSELTGVSEYMVYPAVAGGDLFTLVVMGEELGPYINSGIPLQIAQTHHENRLKECFK